MKTQPHISSYRKREKGQTLALVALSIVALLGFAALAIDVATLYVAHSEVQRAADAAALAGAKVIADSGVTSLQIVDPNYDTLMNDAILAATAEINQLVASRNQVAGGTPTLSAGTPTFNFTPPNDPQITVTIQRTALPVFFAKIWGQRTVTSSATARAEAYSPTGIAPYTQINPRCVKPWLVLNNDGTGQLVTNGIVNPIDLPGKKLTLQSDCKPGSSNCILANIYPSYLPGQVVPNSSNVCPSCVGAIPYEQSIECCDAGGPPPGGKTYSCGPGAASWDFTINPNAPGGDTQVAGQCLIHATGPGPAWTGQDVLAAPPPAVPIQIQTTSGATPGLVTTSQSIVTVPIISPPPAASSGGPVDVVGFMQAFVRSIDDIPGVYSGAIEITVLNIAACGPSDNGAFPIVGGSGTSPVAVRLISPPTP